MISANSPHNSMAAFVETLVKFKIIRKYQLDTADRVRFVNKNTKTKLVLVLGSNPSMSSPSNIAFDKATRSRQVIDSWFYTDHTNRYCLYYDNLYNLKTPNNRPLSPGELRSVVTNIHNRIQAYQSFGVKIVACGKQVHEVLTKQNIEHFYMPHPSGANRFWNDKIAGAAKIKEMLEWING